MSKIICAHFRNVPPPNLEKKLVAICKTIEPDNISSHKPNLIQIKNGALAIMNPMETNLVHKGNVLLGSAIEEREPWAKIGTDYPDGSYALFRNNRKISEVVTDAVASRTIWYYFDNEQFLAATSQRAIILFLESFEFDERCIPWMLSTGSLGPEYSWDKRIKRMPPATVLVLDKEKWSLNRNTREIRFEPFKGSFKAHKERLYEAIASTLKKMELDLNHWVLPLSGGYDSRGILYFMTSDIAAKSKPRTITWGLKESLTIADNDAFVAQKIARSQDVLHKYYHTNISSEPIKDILGRFIRLGEGRIDHISGYMDGFKIWKALFEDNIQGIIRGDEGFGLMNVVSPLNVRYFLTCALCSDYTNLKEYCQRYDIADQKMPAYMERQSYESLSSWRDRLYHQYRLPTILAALSDLKLGYVEQTSPLLSNEILKVVRQIPDNLRTNKKLFKKIVNEFKPNIAYATKGANAPPTTILRRKDTVAELRRKLSSAYAKSVIPELFLESAMAKLRIGNRTLNRKLSFKQELIRRIKMYTPKFIKNILPVRPPLSVDDNLLAFRLYIIISMHQLLNNECENLRQSEI